MNPLVARSSREAHLHMDLTPCECGNARFDRASTVVALPDGDLARQYTGTCAGCGRSREFVFRFSDEVPEAGETRYGGDEPSRLIDAGQWLWVADSYARGVPPDPHRLAGPDRDRAKARLASAVAALDEVLKFASAGAERVPLSAVWTPLGRSVYADEPGRLRVGRLAAVRAAYDEVLRRFD